MEPLYQRAQAIREKELGANHVKVAQLLNDRAVSLEKQVRVGEDSSFFVVCMKRLACFGTSGRASVVEPSFDHSNLR